MCLGRYACCFSTLSSSSHACDIDIVVLFGALFVNVFYCAREAVLSMAMLAVVSHLLAHGSAASDADAKALALKKVAAAACIGDDVNLRGSPLRSRENALGVRGRHRRRILDQSVVSSSVADEVWSLGSDTQCS